MKCDVVVVGAGPAGSTAARTAAEAGLDVVLLEKRQEIGEPVRCAEGLSIRPELAGLFRLRPEWISTRVRGARFYAPCGSSITVVEQQGCAGYVLERKLYDRGLAIEAARAGARVLVKTAATGLERKNPFSGSKGSLTIPALCRGEPMQIEASIVIGADGVESRVAGWAGIDSSLSLGDSMTCAQFLVWESSLEQDYCHFFFGNKKAPGGYLWIFPKGGHLANVGIAVQGSQSAPGMPLYLLKSFLSAKMPEAEILQLVTGGIPATRPMKTAVSDGVMLAGDSAHQSDPLTGGGIINAVRAGELAAEVAVDAISSGDVSREELVEYDRRWKATIGKEMEMAYRAKEFFLGLCDDDFNRLAEPFQGKSISCLDSRDLLKALFRLNPRMLWSLKRVLF